VVAVHTLDLGSVRLPDWHPRAADGTCVIQAWAIEHRDGVILFDTGVADDHPLINELYDPTVVGVVDALASVGIDERNVSAIVNSHLHFDHCGQNRTFPATPVYAQRAEIDLVDVPLFTVPEWARVEPERLRVIDGDEQLADGVTIVATPGHTPGHQSVVVDDGIHVTVLAGQCCYDCTEFSANDPAVEDLHDDSWLPTARRSIERLHALRPHVVHLAHDRSAWRTDP
jgi:glyoxylase-like metal-dependent hydrolase (beta-lactamase superfamily II)